MLNGKVRKLCAALIWCAALGLNNSVVASENNNRNAYSQPDGQLPLSQKLDFHVGNSFFRNPWISAPATTDARDGLGPLYNTNACQNCHIRDGRGHLPKSATDNSVSLILRLSLPAKNTAEKVRQSQHGPQAVPAYGKQLQDFALPGVAAEGRITLSWSALTVNFDDGDTIELRRPSFEISDLGYGPLPRDVEVSARIAPPMIGLGLLAAIDENTLRTWSDPEDRDGDGISGRINQVKLIGHETLSTGRFGWKAGQPSLAQQNAAAFHGDMGLSSRLFLKQACEPIQEQCLAMTTGGTPEVSDNILDAITFYTHNLAVPSPTRITLKNKGTLKQGRTLFLEAGCQQCHKTSVFTGTSSMPWLEKRLIHPYTDLLLHDMGAALADGRAEFSATGQEWRTAPLWGIGLSKAVEPQATFLHDGRARTLLEAIVWHGGEAQSARDKVLSMSRAERQSLISFLNSL